jgi:hypothetical protein
MSNEKVMSVVLNDDSVQIAEMLFSMSHYFSLVTHDMVVRAKMPCECSQSQLNNYGAPCRPCLNRQCLNRATEQFTQAEKMRNHK